MVTLRLLSQSLKSKLTWCSSGFLGSWVRISQSWFFLIYLEIQEALYSLWSACPVLIEINSPILSIIKWVEPFFKFARAGVRTRDLLIFVYFIFTKQHLRPLGYCSPPVNLTLWARLQVYVNYSSIFFIGSLFDFGVDLPESRHYTTRT